MLRATAIRAFLISLALLIACAGPACAQRLELERADIGIRGQRIGDNGSYLHGGVEGLDTWLPCEVVLRNPGAAELSGSLRVISRVPMVVRQRYEARETEIRHALTLGPGAQKRLVFPILYDPAANYRVEFHDESRGPLLLSKGASALERQGLALPLERALSELLVLYVRPPGDAPPALERLQVRAAQEGMSGMDQSREWVLLTLEAASLPRDPLLYHRTEAVLLDDVPDAALSNEQQRALVTFVAGGGLLWNSTLKRRPNPAAPLSGILPGVPATTEELDQIPSLASYSSRPTSLRSVLTFQAKPAAVAWDEHRTALHQRYEQGWVLQTGFRSGDALGADRIELLRDLLLVRERELLPAPSAFNLKLRKDLAGALRGATRKAVPPLLTVVVLLLIYALGAIVIPFLVGRRARRLELAWGGVAAAAILGAAAVMGLGERYAQESQVVRVTLVSGGHEAGPLRQTSHWALFSQDGGDVVLELTREATAHSGRGELEATEPRRVTVKTFPQDTTLLTTSGTHTHPGGLTFTCRDRRGALTNSGPLQLRGAWAYDAKGRELRLDLPKGVWQGALDPGVDAVLEAAKRHVAAMAGRRRRALLLYRYEGEAALSQLPERTLSLGILTAETGGFANKVPAPTRPRPAPDNETDEWSFSAVLPPGCKVKSVSVDPQQRYGGFRRPRPRRQRGKRAQPKTLIFDWTLKRWFRFHPNTEIPANFTTVSPLGVVRGLVRAPMSFGASPHAWVALSQKERRR